MSKKNAGKQCGFSHVGDDEVVRSCVSVVQRTDGCSIDPSSSKEPGLTDCKIGAHSRMSAHDQAKTLTYMK
jgi:hypothetical protein